MIKKKKEIFKKNLNLDLILLNALKAYVAQGFADIGFERRLWGTLLRKTVKKTKLTTP